MVKVGKAFEEGTIQVHELTEYRNGLLATGGLELQGARPKARAILKRPSQAQATPAEQKARRVESEASEASSCCSPPGLDMVEEMTLH